MFKYVLLFGLWCLAGVVPALSQVSVGPTFLFADQQERFGSLVVMNQSDSVQEVDIEFRFGYPATDSAGETVMRYDDQETENLYSAADWITAYPRVFSLNPGERQTVRLLFRPPSDIPDGMYWARIVTGSKALSTNDDETGNRARLTYRLEQITSLFYKQGDVKAGVDIDELTAVVIDEELQIKSPVSRTGNAPFLGSMRADIYDSTGDIIQSETARTTVFIDAVRVMAMNISDLPPGEYTVKLTFSPERSDLRLDQLAPTDPSSASATFRID